VPHLILEYSRNIDEDVEIDGLMRRVHQTLFSFGLWDISALRTRAEPRDKYFIADGDPTHGFVHLLVRIRAGRDDATKKLIGEALLKAMVDYLGPSFAKRKLAVNAEITEVSSTSYLHRTIGT
jgi:5-carboxymethyl-2-hydroxymuconate isomerase